MNKFKTSRGMVVLVSFVMAAVLPLLISSGHSVIAIDREPTAFSGHQGACENNRAEILNVQQEMGEKRVVSEENHALLEKSCARMRDLGCSNIPTICDPPNPDAWVGLWRHEGAPYNLRIKKTPGGNLQGQLTSDPNIGRLDDQRYLGKLVGNSWVGTWQSFPENYRELDAAGNAVPGREGVRRGTFLLTRVSTNRIEGGQLEGEASFINKGRTWTQKFDRCLGDDCSKLRK